MILTPEFKNHLLELSKKYKQENWLPILSLLIEDSNKDNNPDNIWSGCSQVDFLKDDRVSYIPTFSNNRDNSSNNRREMRIGKIASIAAQKLYKKGVDIKPSDLEKFVESYKASINKDKIHEFFEIWKGEDIRKAYLEFNYVDEKEGSSLHNSCMGYSRCQKYLDIYTKNPEVCSVLVFLEGGKIKGRALIWQTDIGQVMDRVYYTLQSQVEEFIEYSRSKGIAHRKDGLKNYAIEKTNGKEYYPSMIKIQLKNWKFEYYPFLDTFCSLYYSNGILSKTSRSNWNVYTLQSMDGLIGTVCEYCDGTGVEEYDNITKDCEHCKEGNGMVYIPSPFSK